MRIRLFGFVFLLFAARGMAAWCPQVWLGDCSADAAWRYLADIYAPKDCHNDARALVCQMASESRLHRARFILQGGHVDFASATTAVRDLGRRQDKAAIARLKQRRNELVTVASQELGAPSRADGADVPPGEDEARASGEGDGLKVVNWWKGYTYFSVASGWQRGAYYLVVVYRP